MAPAGSRHGHWPKARGKLTRDLSQREILRSVGGDQIAYYRSRASWYDDSYTCSGDYDRGPEVNSQWMEALATVEAALSAAPVRGDCVELGAGTGYWSERLLGKVTELWALDSAPEMLALAEKRLGLRADRVHFEVVDLWEWKPTRMWDSAVAFFFLEHVPDEVLPGFLATLHGALRAGAPFFVAEGVAEATEPHIETRSIDGRTYQVVERRRSPIEFNQALKDAGFSMTAAVEGHMLMHAIATRV